MLDFIDAGGVDAPPIEEAGDYALVKRAIAFISTRWRDQPSIEAIAEHVGLSPSHFQHLFKRWAGLTPKAFLQAITMDHARERLRDSASVLDAAYDVGLSGPGRLHDLFVTHEAMTPGDYRRRGEGLALTYGFHPSPFGEAIAVTTPRGLAGLGFVDNADRAGALADMQKRWPRAAFVPDQTATAPHIGRPTAARAVGAAVGRNPISFVVPCHRVLGRSGALTGYHWGLARKQAIIGWEAGRVAAH
jgi:AraC family transcriptional regulator of adaptative response/methylated-DNA-[protein]-cysteine methyltransferase